MKIAIVASHGRSLVNLRGELIKDWVKLGHEVVCVSIEPLEEMQEMISELGASYVQVSGKRTGTNIFQDLKMIREYEKMFKREKPDICFLYMAKPLAYGGIAAIRCGIKHVYVFHNGMQMAFFSKGIKNAVLRVILKFLYRRVLPKCEKVFEMCHSDEKRLLDWKMVKRENLIYVEGSGVNMEEFKRVSLPKEPVVLMLARLVWSKGIREYIEAAKIVKKDHPEVRFMLLGPLDENAEALSKEELDRIVNEGIVEYYGYAYDVRPYIEKCSIFTLPSYHEGKGRAILEAEAMARPIVTTNAPGCSETVIDGENGYIVEVKSAQALADKILVLAQDEKLREEMGEKSYQLCLERYDVRKVNHNILKAMSLI